MNPLDGLVEKSIQSGELIDRGPGFLPNFLSMSSDHVEEKPNTDTHDPGTPKE